MQTWEAALLGVVQGLTEFLPVSSSGHLAVLQNLLGLSGDDENLFLILWVHTATLAAVFVFFHRRIGELISGVAGDALAPSGWRQSAPLRYLALLVLSTVVTGVPAMYLESALEALSQNTMYVGIAFLSTGAILLASRRAPHEPSIRQPMDISWLHAVLLGLAQLLAVTPGISRSGTTIVAALLLGWSRRMAFEYSFFMAIPAILVPMLVVGREALVDPGTSLALAPATASFVASALTGFLALAMLARMVDRGNLSRFAWYVIPLGLVCIAARWLA